MRPLLPIFLATAGLFAAGALTSVPAQAQVYISPSSSVYLRAATEVYAGPGYEYPRVEYAPAGRAVNLYGCLTTNDWCDVSTSMTRGWVPSQALAVYRNQQYYDLSQSRSWYAYPLISFVFDRYWNDHYRNRDWYRDRDRYRHHRNWERPGPRPGIDPRFRDRDRDGTPNYRDRDRNNDGRPDWRNRDGRGNGRDDHRNRNERDARDYRGLPRRNDRVGNTPAPNVPTPDVRRPRPDVPRPDVRRPGSDVPPQNRIREPRSDRPAPRRNRVEEVNRAGQATQIE